MLNLKKGGTTQNFNTQGKSSFTAGINSLGNNTSLLQDLSNTDQKSIHPVKGQHGQTNVRSSEVKTRFCTFPSQFPHFPHQVPFGSANYPSI